MRKVGFWQMLVETPFSGRETERRERKKRKKIKRGRGERKMRDRQREERIGQDKVR